MSRTAGFTVLELILAIIVTGIVAMALISGVRTHLIREQVTSGMQLAYPWRLLVETNFQRSGQIPSTWEELGVAGVSPTSIYVEKVQLVDGRIDVVYGNEAAAAIAGARLSLTPYETAAGTIVWICGNDEAGPGLEPLGFAGGGTQTVPQRSSIPSRYVPPACR